MANIRDYINRNSVVKETEINTVIETNEIVSGIKESLISDDLGNKYEQTVVDGKLTLRLVEAADGTLNI